MYFCIPLVSFLCSLFCVFVLSYIWLFCDPMYCSLPGSSDHMISQTRVLEWIAISYFKGSFWPRIKPISLASPTMAGGFFTIVPPGFAQLQIMREVRITEDLIFTELLACICYSLCQMLCCYCYSVAKSCLILWDPVDCSIPGILVLHYLPEYVQTPVHCISDVIQPFHPMLSASPIALNLSQHQGLFSMSWLFVSGGQSVGASASASASIFPIIFKVISFRIAWFDLAISSTVQGTLKSLF